MWKAIFLKESTDDVNSCRNLAQEISVRLEKVLDELIQKVARCRVQWRWLGRGKNAQRSHPHTPRTFWRVWGGSQPPAPRELRAKSTSFSGSKLKGLGGNNKYDTDDGDHWDVAKGVKS